MEAERSMGVFLLQINCVRADLGVISLKNAYRSLCCRSSLLWTQPQCHQWKGQQRGFSITGSTRRSRRTQSRTQMKPSMLRRYLSFCMGRLEGCQRVLPIPELGAADRCSHARVVPSEATRLCGHSFVLHVLSHSEAQCRAVDEHASRLQCIRWLHVDIAQGS